MPFEDKVYKYNVWNPAWRRLFFTGVNRKLYINNVGVQSKLLLLYITLHVYEKLNFFCIHEQKSFVLIDYDF